MSDWIFLNKHRNRDGHFRSEDSDGFNGLFLFECCGRNIRCIASDGEGWQHVSVSQVSSDKPPNWDVMCAVKDLFWEPENWAVQFHPAHCEYINNHPGCLHLWRSTNAVQPKPHHLLVGIKTKEKMTPRLAMAEMAAATLALHDK